MAASLLRMRVGSKRCAAVMAMLGLIRTAREPLAPRLLRLPRHPNPPRPARSKLAFLQRSSRLRGHQRSRSTSMQLPSLVEVHPCKRRRQCRRRHLLTISSASPTLALHRWRPPPSAYLAQHLMTLMCPCRGKLPWRNPWAAMPLPPISTWASGPLIRLVPPRRLRLPRRWAAALIPASALLLHSAVLHPLRQQAPLAMALATSSAVAIPLELPRPPLPLGVVTFSAPRLPPHRQTRSAGAATS
mmetsp:Transcript_425/g.1382  ORF Transcript_425/g.1382 Transcript_425/m.1382 type:complete len:244 (+) Transcript_425:572-1303(+)